MGQLRIGLTISGAVSLGAYEAGAMAALLVAVQALCDDSQPEVRIDAISGASAGALTALLVPRILHAGLDPVETMRAAWVHGGSLAGMLTSDPHAPLSVEALRQNAVRYLDPHDDQGRPVYRTAQRQRSPIRLHISLTCLRGLSYEIDRLGEHDALQASTYVDWGQFTFHPDDELESTYLQPRDAAPVDFVLASAAHVIGFPPRRLRRSQDEATYAAHHVTNFPESGWLWYADGGVLDNEPLQHALDLTGAIDREEPLAADDRRLHMVIHPLILHPRSSLVAGDNWAEPSRQPAWTSTLVRVELIQRVQHLYENLRAMEKMNSRVQWTARTKDVLDRLLTELQQRDPDTYADWCSALDEMLRDIQRDKGQFSRHHNPETPEDRASAMATLAAILDQITDTGGKEAAYMEVVSPLQLEDAREGTRVRNLLAGDMLGAFGGFLNEDLRLHDFTLGYRSMLVWLEREAEGHGVRSEAARRAIGSARARVPSDLSAGSGTRGFFSLPRRDRFTFYRLAAHVLRVVLHESILDDLHAHAQHILRGAAARLAASQSGGSRNLAARRDDGRVQQTGTQTGTPSRSA